MNAVSRRRFGAGIGALALVGLFGVVRLPLEAGLTRERQAARFGAAPLGLSLREQLGQGGFLAALSGFRALVADGVWLQAHAAWEHVAYGRLHRLLDTATTLVPHHVEFWDAAAWHMAYNAAAHVREDAARQPRAALRRRAERQYILLGKDYAERGIVHNPDARDLHLRLGMILRDRLGDPGAAAAAFARAAGCPRALGFEHRFAAYSLAACPGREREAYWLLRFYHDFSERERLPTLERLLRELELKLDDLPAEQRVYKTDPRGS